MERVGRSNGRTRSTIEVPATPASNKVSSIL
jgi:hypothetical protein